MVQNDTVLVATLVAACSLWGCNLDTAGEREHRMPPTPARAAVTSPKPVPIERAAKTELTPQAVQLESSGATPSAEVVAKVSALHQQLESVVGHAEGSRVAFVDCQGNACRARLTASTLGQLRSMLRGVSQDQQGQLGFVVRERLDPYLGRSFEADLTLGTDATRAVPEDDAQLLEGPVE